MENQTAESFPGDGSRMEDSVGLRSAGDANQMIFLLSPDGSITQANKAGDGTNIPSGLLMSSAGPVTLPMSSSSLVESQAPGPVSMANKNAKFFYQDMSGTAQIHSDRGDNSQLTADKSGAMDPALQNWVPRLSHDKEIQESVSSWSPASVQAESFRMTTGLVDAEGSPGSKVVLTQSRKADGNSSPELHPGQTAKPGQSFPQSPTFKQPLATQNLGRSPQGFLKDAQKIVIFNRMPDVQTNSRQIALQPAQQKAVDQFDHKSTTDMGFKKKKAAILRKAKGGAKELTPPTVGLNLPVAMTPVGMGPIHLTPAAVSSTSMSVATVTLVNSASNAFINFGQTNTNTTQSLDLSRMSVNINQVESLQPTNLTVTGQRPKAETPHSDVKLQSPGYLESVNMMPPRPGPDYVVKKTYADSSLPRLMLAHMWDMLLVEMLCDVILHMGTEQMKLHKLVLASISPVVNSLVVNSSAETDLEISIPSDISTEAVREFIFYLYNSEITLTLGNVNHLYRISNIFQLEDLRQHCYDFCKVAKSGHLIIDTASEKINLFHPPAATNKDIEREAPEVEDKKAANAESNQPAGQPVQSAEKSQLNIPIRKRNRSRKEVSDTSTEPTNAKGGKMLNTETSHSVSDSSSVPAPYGLQSQEAMKPESEKLVSEMPGLTGTVNTKDVIQTRSRGKKRALLTQTPTTSSSVQSENDAVVYTKLASKKNPAAIEDDLTGLEILLSVAETPAAVDKNMARKGRQRRVPEEKEVPVKDEVVYMRQPPKKRTKEIREMMQHENNTQPDTSQVPNLSFPAPPTKAVSEVSAKGKPAKPRPKRRPPAKCDAAVTEKVAELEQIAAEAAKVSTKEKQYKCNLCENEFMFPKRVVSHIFKTHDVKLEDVLNFITVEDRAPSLKMCDICGYKTKDQNLYYIHYHKYFRHGVPLPQGWKPFKCDLCGKECFTKFQLRDHKLIHFEDTPFICEHCGSGFKSRTCLNSHVFHRHNSVRRHNCTECTKTFKTRTQMLVHLRTHTGEKPFHCPDCSYKSTTRGNMRLHLVNRHKYTCEHIKDIMSQLKVVMAVDEEEEDAFPSGTEAVTTSGNIPAEGQESQTNGTGNFLPVEQETQVPTESHQDMSSTQLVETLGRLRRTYGFESTSSDGMMTDANLERSVQVLIHDDNENQNNEIRIFLSQDFQANPERIIPVGERRQSGVQQDISAQLGGPRMTMHSLAAADTPGILQEENMPGDVNIDSSNIIPVSEVQLVQVSPSLFQDGQGMVLDGRAQNLADQPNPGTQDIVRVDNSHLPSSVMKQTGLVHSADQGAPPPSYRQTVLSPSSTDQDYLGPVGPMNLPAQTMQAEPDRPNPGLNISEGQAAPLPTATNLTGQPYDSVTSQNSSTSQYSSDPSMMMYVPQGYYHQNYPQGY